MNAAEIILVGLLIDVTGAYTIAHSLVRKTPKDSRAEHNQILGAAHYTFGVMQQQFEARLGFSYLLTGFLMQGVATTDITNSGTVTLPIFSLYLIFGLCFFYLNFRIVPEFRVLYARRRVLREYGNEFANRLEKSSDLLEIIRELTGARQDNIDGVRKFLKAGQL